MKLFNIVDENKKEIITVVGAGGKTSFINYLVNYYRKYLKVLSTTTTKIYKPQEENYDTIIMLNDNENSRKIKNNSATVCGKYIDKDNKIVGLDFDELKRIIPNFDLIFIEGDGSKKKKLKGWREDEPIVYPYSTKTIGILDITAYNLDIKEENIHRVKEFKKLIEEYNSKTSINNLKDIILHKNGIFKNAKGEKILFINKVENSYYERLTISLIKEINKEIHNISIFYGSIKEDTIKEVRR